MSLDVILIADSNKDSFSASNPLRLSLDGHTATFQVARNFIANQGRVIPPVEGNSSHNWEAAPKLNGIYLYNYLCKQGIETALINNFGNEQERFRELAAEKPAVVAISTTFIVTRPALLKLVDQVKELCPETTVIVGGPFVNISWQILQRSAEPLYSSDDIKQSYLFQNSQGDQADLYIVSDLGEQTLAEAVKRIKSGHPLDDLPNTCRPVNGTYVFAPRADDVTGWQETPIDWANLPEEFFSAGVVPMRASVGCPYRCSFCNFNKDPRLTYVKPLDQIITEIKAVQKRGVRYIWFVDDNFRLGKRDLEQVCQRFIEEKISVEWMTLIRAEAVKDIDLGLLKQAGCREVQLGIESAAPEILKRMNKQSDPAFNEKVIKKLIKAGINCACYFIFGFPGETEETIASTIAFIKRLEDFDGPGLFSWSVYPFVMAPFSPVYEQDFRSEYALDGHLLDWQHHSMDSNSVQEHLKQAFLAMEKSSPIYRGDNLEQFKSISPGKQKRFMAVRHKLAKLALTQQLDNVMAYHAFADVFDFVQEEIICDEQSVSGFAS